MVAGDRVHLQQVVLNLVINAMDAIADVACYAGRVLVRTVALPHAVEITIADNGPGIDAKLAPQLFDSFVTTKEHGLGLGLSIARSIVEAHGGSIDLVNGDGGGAVCRVCLPVQNVDRDAPEQGPLRPSVARTVP
jgi:signal transduction histidine kinase